MSETSKPDMSANDLDAERLEQEALDWLRRLTSGDMTEGEVAVLDRWRATSAAHRRAFAEANLLWDALEPVARAGRVQSVADLIPPPHILARPIGRRALLAGAAGAALGGAAYVAARPPWHLWPGLSELAADYRTGVGERRQVPLQAGISVEMNTRTSLSALREDSAATTLELVSGQVAVSMEDSVDKRIVVAAGAGETRALRAHFDVRKDGDTVCVTCSRGAVEVAVRSASATLRTGEQIAYGIDGLGTVSTVDLAVTSAWLRGLLIFRDAPLKRVIDEVNRYRPGRIILLNSTLAERKIVAGFRLDQIDDVVSYIIRVFGARAQALPGGIVLLT